MSTWSWGGGSTVWWGAANGGLIGFDVKMTIWICQIFSCILKNVPKWAHYTPQWHLCQWELDDMACYPGYAAHFPSALGKLQSTERSVFSSTAKWITISLSFRLLVRVYVYHTYLKASENYTNTCLLLGQIPKLFKKPKKVLSNPTVVYAHYVFK